jgi:5-methylcytosine-specific restriction protein A
VPSVPPRHRPFPAATKQDRAAYDARRQSDRSFYWSAAWRAVRAAVLAAKPLCEECSRHGVVRAATDVHHMVERKDDPTLALVESNLEALCHSCHSKHTRHHAAARG